MIRKDKEEARALCEDILIHVTSFFRDKEVFEALKSRILPAILEDKAAGAPVRVWVAGCSTGEEVYSLGIALLELLGDSRRVVQIFGSDLSEATIAKARAGVYPDSALRDMSEERRRAYFLKTEGGYKINKIVRDLCIFVQQDLARDPLSRQIEGLLILVVDDDPATRDAMAEMHEEMGAKVRVAESAAAALIAVGEFKPGVLLCDIAMPGEDGFSFIRRLRALGPGAGGDIPALALTALAGDQDESRALSAGFQMYLTKPVDLSRLSQAVVALSERAPM